MRLLWDNLEKSAEDATNKGTDSNIDMRYIQYPGETLPPSPLSPCPPGISVSPGIM